MGSVGGKRILVTRAVGQAESLIEALCAAGAIPVAFPCIEIGPPDRPNDLSDANQKLAANQFDWLILTSQNAIRSLEGLSQLPVNLKVGTVGPGTAYAFEARFGRLPDFVGRGGTGLDLARDVPVAPGDAVLLPQSAIASAGEGEILRDRGGAVTEFAAYVTRTPAVSKTSVDDLFDMDGITFASASAVRGFEELAPSTLPATLSVPVACIGASTAEAARAAGFLLVSVAADQSVDGLMATLETMFINHHVLQETTR